ncbi:MAG: alpha/beta fold hydrolase [Candidatus Eisenbacteria bacterium]|nr:alpha/beta fold hydrolase [Candidatus Eisenbacteria bacterium]
MTTTKFSISGADGLGIRGHVHRPASTNGAVPVLVFMHGFKGFQGWGPWAAVCDRFAENGVAAIRFDLSHNGVGDDGIAFSALDRFERNTIDAELFDLEAVLDWIGSGAVDVDPVAHEPLLPKLDPERVVLLGHSRGGGGILLGAAERLGLSPDAPPDRSRAGSGSVTLRGLVTWSAIATYERGWAVEAIDRWERGESVPVWNKRTEQMMPLGPQLYRDYMARPQRYDIQAATRRLGGAGLPVLFVHGAEDETVPVAEVSLLESAYAESAAKGAGATSSRCAVVPGGDHTYGTKHPFEGWTGPLEAAFEHALRFTLTVTEEDA